MADEPNARDFVREARLVESSYVCSIASSTLGRAPRAFPCCVTLERQAPPLEYMAQARVFQREGGLVSRMTA